MSNLLDRIEGQLVGAVNARRRRRRIGVLTSSAVGGFLVAGVATAGIVGLDPFGQGSDPNALPVAGDTSQVRFASENGDAPWSSVGYVGAAGQLCSASATGAAGAPGPLCIGSTLLAGALRRDPDAGAVYTVLPVSQDQVLLSGLIDPSIERLTVANDPNSSASVAKIAPRPLQTSPATTSDAPPAVALRPFAVVVDVTSPQETQFTITAERAGEKISTYNISAAKGGVVPDVYRTLR